MKKIALALVAIMLLALVGCTTSKVQRLVKDPTTGQTVTVIDELDYNGAMVRINEVRAQNPRNATIKLTPIDPKQPIVFANGTLEAIVPLDAHFAAVVPESFGKQAGHVLEKATPLGIAYTGFDFLKAAIGNGGTRTTMVNQSSTGPQSANSAPGGNQGNATISTDSHAVDNHSVNGGEPAAGQ